MKTIKLYLYFSSDLSNEQKFISYLAILLDRAFARRGFYLCIKNMEFSDVLVIPQIIENEFIENNNNSSLFYFLVGNKFVEKTLNKSNNIIDVTLQRIANESYLSLFLKESQKKHRSNISFQIKDRYSQVLFNFVNNEDLAVHFLFALNKFIAKKFHAPFLRIDNGWIFVDETRLFSYSVKFDMTYIKGKDLSSSKFAYVSKRNINMLLASTQDLQSIRNDFCDLILAWNNILIPRGIKLFLIFFDKNHLDELEDISEIASIFYWKDFGEFDQNVFQHTYQRIIDNRTPQKCYTFFRREDERKLAHEFMIFKNKMSDEDSYAHFYIDFSTSDELRQKFLLQFEMYLCEKYCCKNDLLETRNGFIYVKNANEPLVNLSNLPALLNIKEYIDIKNALERIDKNRKYYQLSIHTLLDNKKLSSQEEKRLNNYKNNLLELDHDYDYKQNLADKIEKIFLFTSRQVAKLMQYIRNSQLKYAISLFEEGKIKECQYLLDRIISNVDDFIKYYQERQKLWQEKARITVYAYLLKANVNLRDFSIKGEKRHYLISQNYMDALDIAQEFALPDSEIINLILLPFIDWLYDENDYKKGLEIISIATEKCKNIIKKHNQSYLPTLSTILDYTGLFQEKSNLFDKANESYKNALKIYHKLIKKQPDIYLPNLAELYNNIGMLYYHRKNYKQSEKSYSEAYKIYQELEKKHSNVFLTALATIKNNIATLQYDMKQYEDAEKSYRDAIRIYRRLENHDPIYFKSKLAMVLGNLGSLQCDIANYSKAKKYSLESINIYRNLIITQPNSFLPDLALSLNIYGNILRSCYDYSNAEYMYKESLQIYQRLSKIQPESFQSEIAGGFQNLGNILSDKKQYKTAKYQYLQAIKIRRYLSSIYSDVALPDLVTSLISYGELQCNFKHYNKSLEIYNEALILCKKIIKKQPNIYLETYAQLLHNIGKLYYEADNHDSYKISKKYYSKSINIYKELSVNNHVYYIDIAEGLNNLANLQSRFNHYSIAEKLYNEALIFVQKSSKIVTEIVFSSNLSNIYNNLGNNYCDINNYHDAIKSYKKALKLRQQLVQKQPNVYLPDLADTLNNFGMVLFESGHYKKAETSYNKSYNIYKTLFQKDPDTFLPNLIHVMFNIGYLQYYRKKYFYAEKNLNKAIDIFLKHTIVRTDFLHKIIAQTFSYLGNVQACLQHYIIAEKSYKKAIEFYRILSKDTFEVCSDFLSETLQNLEYVQKINNR